MSAARLVAGRPGRGRRRDSGSGELPRKRGGLQHPFVRRFSTTVMCGTLPFQLPSWHLGFTRCITILLLADGLQLQEVCSIRCPSVTQQLHVVVTRRHSGCRSHGAVTSVARYCIARPNGTRSTNCPPFQSIASPGSSEASTRSVPSSSRRRSAGAYHRSDWVTSSCSASTNHQRSSSRHSSASNSYRQVRDPGFPQLPRLGTIILAHLG